MPKRGLILTSTTAIERLRRHAEALAAGDDLVIKLVTGWGLSWTPELRREALRIAPATIVRTVQGDSSYDEGKRTFLHPEHVEADVQPFWDVRDQAREFIIELGNEQLLQPEPDDKRAHDHAYYLSLAIDVCRRRFPGAKLIAPAHMVNHPVAVGRHAWGQERYVELHAAAIRRCDYAGIHGYSVEQVAWATAMIRRHVGAIPLFLTEFALNETLSDEARGQRYAELLRQFDVAGVTLYHLDEIGGKDPAHFRENYRLNVPTLQSLGRAWRAAEAPPTPAPTPKPAPPAPKPAPTPAKPFAVDIRHWPTVAAFAAHLAAHSPSVCSWVQGITLHHTISPTVQGWRGRESVERLLRYYRDEAPWVDAQGTKRKGWSAGPQLFFGPDGIWQLTPLNMRGVHAVSFNDTHWGWEVVGTYDITPWSPATRELVEGALAAALRWLGKPASVINGHRDDPKTTKSCPGRAIDLNVVRANVARRIGATR